MDPRLPRPALRRRAPAGRYRAMIWTRLPARCLRLSRRAAAAGRPRSRYRRASAWTLPSGAWDGSPPRVSSSGRTRAGGPGKTGDALSRYGVDLDTAAQRPGSPPRRPCRAVGRDGGGRGKTMSLTSGAGSGHPSQPRGSASTGERPDQGWPRSVWPWCAASDPQMIVYFRRQLLPQLPCGMDIATFDDVCPWLGSVGVTGRLVGLPGVLPRPGSAPLFPPELHGVDYRPDQCVDLRLGLD